MKRKNHQSTGTIWEEKMENLYPLKTIFLNTMPVLRILIFSLKYHKKICKGHIQLLIWAHQVKINYLLSIKSFLMIKIKILLKLNLIFQSWLKIIVQKFSHNFNNLKKVFLVMIKSNCKNLKMKNFMIPNRIFIIKK